MFQLHERLAADTHKLGESRLCDVLLMNDSTWPWIILVPRVSGIREIYQLASEQQHQLLAESSVLSEGMMDLFAGDKMNVAALGTLTLLRKLYLIGCTQVGTADVAALGGLTSLEVLQLWFKCWWWWCCCWR